MASAVDSPAVVLTLLLDELPHFVPRKRLMPMPLPGLSSGGFPFAFARRFFLRLDVKITEMFSVRSLRKQPPLSFSLAASAFFSPGLFLPVEGAAYEVIAEVRNPPFNPIAIERLPLRSRRPLTSYSRSKCRNDLEHEI